MLRSRALLLHRLLLAVDASAGALLFVLLISLPPFRPTGPFGPRELGALIALGVLATALWPLLLEQRGLYASQRRTALPVLLARLAGTALLATVLLAGAAVLLGAPLQPEFSLAFGSLQLFALGSLRIALYIALRALRKSGRNYRNVFIAGVGPRAAEARRELDSHPEWGQRFVGYIDETGRPMDAAIASEEVYKIVDLDEMVKHRVVDEVIVACPRSVLTSLEPLVGVCAKIGVPITLLSDLFGDYLPPPRVTRFGSLAALSFATVHHGRVQLYSKRLIDIVGSAALLLLTAPVIAAGALAIRWTSPGPLLFRQLRCGLNGRTFEMLKLRTMVVDAEARRGELLDDNEMDGPVFKIRNDPRITRVGRILRRWSIDELPQLWNVLRGDMSLVGPRPPLPEEVHAYATFQRRRLSMRPGITCLWQVSGRNAIGFDEWVKLDLQYIDSWRLVLDLRILLKTVVVVLRQTGAS